MSKDFRYEINVMEQAANKMNRTGYKMKGQGRHWACFCFTISKWI